jgi:NTE family protein
MSVMSLFPKVEDDASERRARKSGSANVALALGGGGARGLAHIVVIETLDELGLRPKAIAGTSIGAIVGAAYAAGMSGKEIGAYALALTRRRSDVMGRLLKARVGRFADILSRGLTDPVLIDAELVLDLFWPEGVPDRFEDLALPFTAVATDFRARCEVALSSGPLAPAVAGSMAIPGLIRPVEAGGRVLIDGGAVNPLPYDLLFGTADIVIAIDVLGGPNERALRSPSPFAAMFGAAQIMQIAITREKLKARAPDLLLQPAVGTFGILDFFKLGQILRAAEPVKDELKRGLARVLEAS